MVLIMKKGIILAVITIVTNSVIAQTNLDNSNIIKFDSNEISNFVKISNFDLKGYGDSVNTARGLNGPLRIAYPIPINSSFKSITKNHKKDGYNIYTLTIKSENLNYANTISLMDINLKKEARFRIYDDTGKVFTFFISSDTTKLKYWLSPKFDSKSITIEFSTLEPDFTSDFNLFQINHGLLPQRPQHFRKSCPDQVDVRCSPEGDDWKKEVNGVVNLIIFGVDWCEFSNV